MTSQVKRQPNREKIVKRLDSQIKEWRKHCERCGFNECTQQLQTLEFIRYGRNK